MPELILSEFKCTCMYGFINKHLEPDSALPHRLQGRIWSGLAFFSFKNIKCYGSGLGSGDCQLSAFISSPKAQEMLVWLE